MAKEKNSEAVASVPQVIYLLTIKDMGCVENTAFVSFTKASNVFNGKCIACKHAGYNGTTNTMYDDEGETYVKVAKFSKGNEVIRLRLELVKILN